MSHSGSVRDGVRLTVRQEYGKKAYLGEYRWNNDHGINVRWQLEKIEDTQHYTGFETEQSVQDVVNESFKYCLAVKDYLTGPKLF